MEQRVCACDSVSLSLPSISLAVSVYVPVPLSLSLYIYLCPDVLFPPDVPFLSAILTQLHSFSHVPLITPTSEYTHTHV